MIMFFVSCAGYATVILRFIGSDNRQYLIDDALTTELHLQAFGQSSSELHGMLLRAPGPPGHDAKETGIRVADVP
jgi:hypothetical protein